MTQAPDRSALTWPIVLGRLADRIDLTRDEAAWAMDSIMNDEATPAQIAGFGIAMRMKGPTPHEIDGLASAMLGHALRANVDGQTLDIVGSGGDRANTVNISTMSAIVAAAAGARVVKHGNRSASSKSGGADVLEELGVTIALGPEAVERCVAELGIAFCFAPVYHPALRFAGAPRKEIGIPTVFNVLGPLTNPARTTAGLVGCAFEDLAPVVARTFADRGADVLVVRGDDGLDEITTTTTTSAWWASGGDVTSFTIDPADYGIETVPLSALQGGDAVANAAVVREVFAGATGPVRDAVLLNAGAAVATVGGGIDAADPVAGIRAGIERATHAVDSGAAADLLVRWVAVSRRLAG